VNEYQLPYRNGQHHKGHVIKVTGEGELAAQPDTASINLGVITENMKLITAQQQNSQDMTKVIQALLSIGFQKIICKPLNIELNPITILNRESKFFEAIK
jgi:uncharacterized protein YggE